jgi:hypothetical protein
MLCGIRVKRAQQVIIVKYIKKGNYAKARAYLLSSQNRMRHSALIRQDYVQNLIIMCTCLFLVFESWRARALIVEGNSGLFIIHELLEDTGSRGSVF